MSDPLVVLESLTKTFGGFTAVDAISFEVAPGEVVGVLGPNGAGKSTTLRMLAGFLPPTSGRASILGHDTRRAPIRARRALGFLPEGAPAYPDMTVRDFLGFVARAHGFSGIGARTRVTQAIALTDLALVAHQPIETLSKGFRRRVGLAAALLHDPPVLILDEPTDGLDPNQKRAMRALITHLSPNKAIIISTHLLEEVDSICTRALVIARGKIVADDTPRRLAARAPSGRMDDVFRVLTDVPR